MRGRQHDHVLLQDGAEAILQPQQRRAAAGADCRRLFALDLQALAGREQPAGELRFGRARALSRCGRGRHGPSAVSCSSRLASFSINSSEIVDRLFRFRGRRDRVMTWRALFLEDGGVNHRRDADAAFSWRRSLANWSIANERQTFEGAAAAHGPVAIDAGEHFLEHVAEKHRLKILGGLFRFAFGLERGLRLRVRRRRRSRTAKRRDRPG